jgi:hypothetical protein
MSACLFTRKFKCHCTQGFDGLCFFSKIKHFFSLYFAWFLQPTLIRYFWTKNQKDSAWFMLHKLIIFKIQKCKTVGIITIALASFSSFFSFLSAISKGESAKRFSHFSYAFSISSQGESAKRFSFLLCHVFRPRQWP